MKYVKDWIRAALIRAVKTAAQAAVGVMGASAGLIGDIDWLVIASSAGFAAILSVLMSLGGLPEVDGGSNG